MKSLILLLVIALIASETNLRNLSLNYNCEKTFKIKTINVAGQSVSFTEKVGVKNGAAFNEIIVSSNSGSANFVIGGISGSYTKSYSGQGQVMKFNFPPIPSIPITLKASGNMKTSVSDSGKSLIISTSGSFYAQVSVGSASGYSSISASGKGTIISFSRKYTINSNGSISKSGSITSGTISITVKAKPISGNEVTTNYTLWNGWTSS